MRSQIEERTASRAAAFLPCLSPRLRLVAVEMRFKRDQPSQQSAYQNFLNRLEIPVPATILIRSDQTPALARQPDEPRCFVRSQRERLINHHIAIGPQALLGMLHMQGRGARNCDEPNALICEHFVD